MAWTCKELSMYDEMVKKPLTKQKTPKPNLACQGQGGKDFTVALLLQSIIFCCAELFKNVLFQTTSMKHNPNSFTVCCFLLPERKLSVSMLKQLNSCSFKKGYFWDILTFQIDISNCTVWELSSEGMCSISFSICCKRIWGYF